MAEGITKKKVAPKQHQSSTAPPLHSCLPPRRNRFRGLSRAHHARLSLTLDKKRACRPIKSPRGDQIFGWAAKVPEVVKPPPVKSLIKSRIADLGQAPKKRPSRHCKIPIGSAALGLLRLTWLLRCCKLRAQSDEAMLYARI